MEDEWAAQWATNKLSDEKDGKSISVVAPGSEELDRHRNPAFHAAILGQREGVRVEHIEVFSSSNVPIQFFANVPRAAIWPGEAILATRQWPAGPGGFADLGRAMRNELDVSSYRNKDLAFFENGLSQHTAVSNVEVVYDRKFRLSRFGKPDFTVVLVDAYDMSAEDVRLARKTYGEFDGALKMSSYGSVTSKATEAAESMGAEAFKWGELLGRLNRP